MPSDPVEILSGVLLADSLILGLVIGFFWAGVLVARRLGYPARYRLGALGFARPSSGYLSAVWLGMLAGAGALISTIPLNLLSAFILGRLGASTESTVQAPLMEGVQGWVRENPQTAIPATVFVIVLFAPAVEEIIFRGAIFGGLRRLSAFLFGRLREGGKGKTGETVSFVLAALASSAAFALLHFEPVLLPSLLVLAVALCALYRHTGSLLPCFVAHATFNSFAVLILILIGLGALPTQV